MNNFNGLNAVAFTSNDGVKLKIAPVGNSELICSDSIGIFGNISIHGNAEEASKSSIWVFTDEQSHFDKIVLFENENYEWTVELPYSVEQCKAKKNVSSYKIWPFMNNRLNEIITPTSATLWVPVNSKTTLVGGFLTTREYLGILNLVLLDKEIQVEVASKKISYFDEYKFLIDSIASFHIDLINEIGAPTGVSLAMSDLSPVSLANAVFHIRRIMNTSYLPSAIDLIFRSSGHKIVTGASQTNNMTGGKVDTKALVSKPYKFGFKSEGIHSEKFLGLSPSVLPVSRKYLSRDTPENRFVKTFLNDLSLLLIQIERAAKKDRSLTILVEINQWIDQIAEWLENSLWKEVSDQIAGISNSQKLQRASGYKDVLLADIELSQALSIPLDEKTDKDLNLTGDVKEVNKIYEYWCFLTIRKVLKNLYGNDTTEGKNLLLRSKGELNITLASNRNVPNAIFKHKIQNQVVSIELFYNRRFGSPVDSLEGHSYSFSFEPDISIRLKTEAITHWISFDAKYKFEPDSRSLENWGEDDAIEIRRFKKEDLNKMHCYRDALFGTRGSYILYPGGKEEAALFTRQIPNKEIGFPSVGAFSLRPASLNSNVEALEKFIAWSVDVLSLTHSYQEELGIKQSQ